MNTNHNRTIIDGYTLNNLLVAAVSATSLLAISANINITGNDSWITPLITTLGGVYIIFVVYWLGKLFPGKTLIEYLPFLVGTAAGKIIGLAYLLFFAWITITVVGEFAALLFATGVFAHTPRELIAVLLIITTTYAVASGLEVIGRTLSVYWLLMSIFYFLFILLAIPQMNLSLLLPVGDAGLTPIIKSTIVPAGYRGELIVLAMLFPYIRSPREALIAGQVANGLITFFIMITIIALITVLGVETASRSQFAPFSLADFIPTIGVKSILVIIWVIAFWGKVALFQFIVTDGLSQLLAFKEHRSLVIPIAILIFVLIFVFYESSVDIFETIAQVLPGMGLFFEYLIPTLLLLIGLIKTRVIKNGSALL